MDLVKALEAAKQVVPPELSDLAEGFKDKVRRRIFSGLFSCFSHFADKQGFCARLNAAKHDITAAVSKGKDTLLMKAKETKRNVPWISRNGNTRSTKASSWRYCFKSM